MESLELLILKSLFNNKDFSDKVLPYIDDSMFNGYAAKNIANMIKWSYQHSSGNQITLELVKTNIEKLHYIHKITDEQEVELLNYFDRLSTPYKEQPLELLVKETEGYFRQQLTYKSMQNVIKSFGDNKTLNISEIRDLEDSANFTFDSAGFYNYMGQFQQRMEDYTKTQKKYPFPLSALNACTNGGMSSKSLSIAMASTGGGKSIFLCNCAKHLIQLGYNVLYITCEMSVEEISKRIDANLLDATQDSIMQHQIEKDTLEQRMDAIPDKEKWGQLYIKEYPAGFANASILRRDLEEIERNHGNKIDVLVLDYLNLLSSTRYSTKNANTYVVVKAVAEEVRGLGQVFDIPVVSATQSNRSALNKEVKIDAGMEAVSDSYGLPQTCDFMFNIISPDVDNWKNSHFRLLRVLKNRWGDPSMEFLKVHLDTRLARFSDVVGFEKPMQEKPTELCNNYEDRSNGIFKDKPKEKPTEKKEEVSKQVIETVSGSIF